MIKNINKLLLYIFMILLLYCLMYTYLYNSNDLIFDSDSDSDSETDKFLDISYDDNVRYLDELGNIKTGVDNSIVNNPYMTNIKRELSRLNNSINSQDEITLNNLSNVYMKDYLEYVNRTNIVVYNEYEKLKNNYKK